MAVSAPVEVEPLIAFDPDQAPEAAQDVALVVDQVRVETPPLRTVLGLALMEMVAVGAGVTVTVVDCVAAPPGPEQASVKVEFAFRLPVDCEPWGASAPDQAPEAEQDAALVDDQRRVALPPLVSELGVALRLTVGGDAFTETVADWAALPPAPVQVNV